MDFEQLSSAIWVVFLGICCAAFYAYYQRRLLGDLLRALISAGAENEQTAKTLTDIGYGSGLRHWFASRALRKGSGLRRTVEAVYEESAPEPKNPDELFVKKPAAPVPQRYYVPEERRITAEIRYDGEGTTASTLLLTVAAFFVVALITMSLLPWIIRQINTWGYSSQDSTPESSVTTDLSEGTEPEKPEQ